MTIIDIHYGEISLKGKNKTFFESKLINDIKIRAKKLDLTYKLMKNYKSIQIETEQISEFKKILAKTFGIRYFRIGENIERDYQTLEDELIEYFKTYDLTKTFKIVVKRADKTYEHTSMELAQTLGAKICTEFPTANPDLKHPEFVYHVIVNKNNFNISPIRIEGTGGLPFGSAGKAICLISGGIDSPVAVWQMMKRGITPVLYHKYFSPESREIGLIKKLKKIIEEYTPIELELIMAKNNIQEQMKKHKVIPRITCILCKHLMLTDAYAEAIKHSCKAIITGDNLAQVASQTLTNLQAQRTNIKLPILSPLIGMDKEDIIIIARKIGTYDISKINQAPCPALPKAVETNINLDEFTKILADIKKLD